MRLLAWVILFLFAFLQVDFWFWPTIHPIIFGFLPVGFFYQIVYTLALIPAMYFVYKTLWEADERLHVDGEVE